MINNAPRLVPLYSHQIIPAEQELAGNPVFSVHQTDVIIYGSGLAEYFHHEFGAPLPEWVAQEPCSIPFWSDFLD